MTDTSRAYRAAQSILTAADVGLRTVLSDEDADAIDEFFSIQRFPDDCCNIMGIWSSAEFLTDSFPNRPATLTRPHFYTRCGIRCCDMVLKCRINCWGKKVWPDYAMIEEKSLLVSRLGEAVLDAMMAADKVHTLLPWPGHLAAILDLRWQQPRGGCAGFEIDLVVQVGNGPC